MPRRSTVLMVSILSLYFVLHTALARSRWSPHSGFWLIVLRGTKQLYFHFIGPFSETISGQRSTVLDLNKEKKKNPRYSYGLNWRDKQRCAVQWLFWEKFFVFNLFSQSAPLPVYLFVSLFVNLHFLSYYFSALNIFQGFSLYFADFARTLERAVDKLWNGSRVIHTGSLFLESKAWVCFEAPLYKNLKDGSIVHFYERKSKEQSIFDHV